MQVGCGRPSANPNLQLFGQTALLCSYLTIMRWFYGFVLSAEYSVHRTNLFSPAMFQSVQ